MELNWAAQVRDVRLFEIGTGFAPGADGRPVETVRVAGVVTGAREVPHWTSGGTPADVDWWDLKGLFARVVSLANPGASVQVQEGHLVAVVDGAVVGRAGGMSADAPPWAGPLFAFEVDLDPASRPVPAFAPPPTVPAATRDLALVVPWSVAAERVMAECRRVGGALLESIEPIDEYRGAGLPADTRSLAIRLVFRGRDRTLKDTEVDHAVTRMRGTLEKQLGVTLRT